MLTLNFPTDTLPKDAPAPGEEGRLVGAMTQASENFLALCAHHLPGMPEERKRVFVLRCHGMSQKEIVQQENLSVGAVKRDLELSLSSIFDALECDRDGYTASLWMGCHEVCCLADAIAYARGLADGG